MVQVPQVFYDLSDGSRLIAFRHVDASAVAKVTSSIGPSLGCCSRLAKALLLGHEPWTFELERDGRREVIGVGAHTRSAVSSSLEVTLFAELGGGHGFWGGLAAFAGRMAVTRLLVEQIRACLDGGGVPVLKGEFERYSNVKLYVWNLACDAWDQSISGNHRRNISRARKYGVVLVSLPRADAVSAHLRLIGTSLRRRATRGEPTNLASDAREVNEVLGTGHAELFQAALEGEVVSSKIVYTLGSFAYYDSGGTSEHGMTKGASHLLMYSLAQSLRERGMTSLNLDVASVAAGGLARYKADFGADQWSVERVRCNLRSPARLAINAYRAAIRSLHYVGQKVCTS